MAAPQKVGLLAGWGQYPLVIAEALRAQGCAVCCLALKDHAAPELRSLCDDFQWIGLAKLGGAIRYFRRHGVVEATMAGKVHKVLMFQPWSWLKHWPDWRCLRTFYPHFLLAREDRRDDTLLGRLVHEFAVDGIAFRPATDFVPKLLVAEGQLTQLSPTAAQRKDIEFGWRLAKEMGRLDVGQSVAVKDRAVLAIEAIEGTDQCIRRAGTLCRTGGFTVVKVAKPQQDMRFDVPAVGLLTIQTMIDAGARVLAIEAGRTILMDHEQMINLADKHSLAIVALPDDPRPTDRG